MIGHVCDCSCPCAIGVNKIGEVCDDCREGFHADELDEIEPEED